MLKARRRTTTSDETDERNRSRFVVAYKTLPIGARKKMFKDAERYFRGEVCLVVDGGGR